MGQSVLRDGRAPFRRDGRWPPLPSADRKGVGFRSPNPEWRRWAPRGVQCGNATDPGEAGGSPGESSLFFVKGRAPWNGFAPFSFLRRQDDFPSEPLFFPRSTAEMTHMRG
uniref:Uncharacterized protein n=1 Tax=Callithrix jacchus TaxID=9483 RepID=A0A8I3WD77_CALJA